MKRRSRGNTYAETSRVTVIGRSRPAHRAAFLVAKVAEKETKRKSRDVPALLSRCGVSLRVLLSRAESRAPEPVADLCNQSPRSYPLHLAGTRQEARQWTETKERRFNGARAGTAGACYLAAHCATTSGRWYTRPGTRAASQSVAVFGTRSEGFARASAETLRVARTERAENRDAILLLVVAAAAALSLCRVHPPVRPFVLPRAFVNCNRYVDGSSPARESARPCSPRANHDSAIGRARLVYNCICKLSKTRNAGAISCVSLSLSPLRNAAGDFRKWTTLGHAIALPAWVRDRKFGSS